ncbi:MAG: hypothetical protein ACJ8E9_00655, partial [Sphingomicrobium sp.]
MKNFLGTGGASVIAAALLLSVGGSGQALAQQVNNLPVVQALVRTAVPGAATSVPTGVSGTDAEVAREAGWLKQNGWPLYALVD